MSDTYTELKEDCLEMINNAPSACDIDTRDLRTAVRLLVDYAWRTVMNPPTPVAAEGEKLFTMLMEPHTPEDPKYPCRECILDAGSILCMDKSYCEFKETGKTWKRIANG